MRLRPSSQTPEAGFSLVEIMVAMVVLSGLAGSVFFFLSSQSGMETRSNDLLKGLNLGKLGMDSLKVSDYAALHAGSDTLADRYIRSWRISVVTDGAGNPNGRKKIDLTVHWPKTADHFLTFTSIMSDGRFKERE